LEDVIRSFGISGAAIALLALLLSSCREKPEYSHLPRQYQAGDQNDLVPNAPLVVMGTTIPEDGTATGVFIDNTAWAWTSERPGFRCFLRDGGPWQLFLQYATVRTTLKDTGPVTVSVSINHLPFSKFVVSVDGKAEYVRDVPAELAISGAVRVDLTIEPSWRSPRDGQRLGFLIHAVGFRRRPA
jgi:hypothetical protein